MAKDGTNRGGRRVRAGDKPDALADKIANGREATVMEFPMTELNGAELTNAADLYGEEMPQPSEYLSAKQRDGRPLGADEIFRETWIWLKERGCEKLVNPRLIESYAQSFARFIQCDEAVSSYGLRLLVERFLLPSSRWQMPTRNKQISCGTRYLKS